MKSNEIELKQLIQNAQLDIGLLKTNTTYSLPDFTLHETEALFKKVATDPTEQRDAIEKAKKGDVVALACIAAALYKKGEKDLAFEYFEKVSGLAKDKGDGVLELAIAKL